MATLTKTRPLALEQTIVILEQILNDHAAYRSRGYQHSGSHEHSVTLFDREQQRFALLDVGWFNQKHSCKTVVMVEIISSKLWLQQDTTAEGIADELVQAGVSPQQIILGFRPLELRAHTGFAAE
jgi:hypothetical protein